MITGVESTFEEVTVDSLFAEPDLLSRTPWKQRTRVGILPFHVSGRRLAPTGSRSFPPEASPLRVWPSIESP